MQQRLLQIEQQRLFDHADKVGDRIKDDVFARYKDTHVVDKDLTDSWLEREANNDPALKQAFINAVLNPHAVADRWGRTNEQIFSQHYNRILKRLDDKLAPQKRDNITLNEDRAAVVHAVTRGQSTSALPEEPAPNFGQMSDNELREYTRKHFGFV